MTGKTHAAVGVVSTAALIMLYPKGFDVSGIRILPIVSLVTAVTGSYLPDIDIQRSALGQRHRIISRMLKHRGATHSLIVPLFIVVLIYAISKYLAVLVPIAILLNSVLFGLLFGWVLHIFADMFNKKGVPLLYPFTRSHFHIASVKTAHWSEGVWLMMYIACVVGVAVMKGAL